MRQGDRAAYWASHIRNQSSSGMSDRAYCRQHRLSEPSFYSWRERLELVPEESGDTGSDFAEVV